MSKTSDILGRISVPDPTDPRTMRESSHNADPERRPVVVSAGTIKPPARPEEAVSPTGPPRLPSRARVLTILAERTGLRRREVAQVLAGLRDRILQELSLEGPGQALIPGVARLRVIRTPATRARSGINPFTKQPIVVKARPAQCVVRALPVKQVKHLA